MRDRIPNPTKAYEPDLQAQMDATKPGQAHWAGSGPAGVTCRQCQLFVDTKRDKAGFLKTGRCAKVAGKLRFAHNAGACKHFVETTGKAPAVKVMQDGSYRG